MIDVIDPVGKLLSFVRKNQYLSLELHISSLFANSFKGITESVLL